MNFTFEPNLAAFNLTNVTEPPTYTTDDVDIFNGPSMSVPNSSFSPNLTMFSESPASTTEAVLLSMLFIVIGTVGLVGNCLVIIVILHDRKMRQSITNIFIMNLALADFIIMLVGVPEIVQFMMNQGWQLGMVLCKMNRFILVVCLYVSILSLVFVCIER